MDTRYYGVKNVNGIYYYLRFVQEQTYTWTTMKSKAHKFKTEEAEEVSKQYDASFIEVNQFNKQLGYGTLSVEEKNVIDGKEVDFVRVKEAEKEMIIYYKNGTMQHFKNVLIKVEGVNS
ncbi:hypothetical protein [Bacillus paranthracis]|uniref:hypothetical protein n=1 Tax=Bacillus paranthracis TaxID=2026186 RepID=UPI0022E33E91|nr:hypothetical protein [Bacillus paranthracis]